MGIAPPLSLKCGGYRCGERRTLCGCAGGTLVRAGEKFVSFTADLHRIMAQLLKNALFNRGHAGHTTWRVLSGLALYQIFGRPRIGK